MATTRASKELKEREAEESIERNRLEFEAEEPHFSNSHRCSVCHTDLSKNKHKPDCHVPRGGCIDPPGCSEDGPCGYC